jgi:outer membrane protein TolC
MAFFVGWFLLGSGRATAAAAPRKLTLVDAIRLAVDKGPEIQAARLGVAASEERVSGASSQRFPRLHVDANMQYWDKSLELVLGAPTMMTGAPAGEARPS